MLLRASTIYLMRVVSNDEATNLFRAMGNEWSKLKFAAAEIAYEGYFDAGKSNKWPREDVS